MISCTLGEKTYTIDFVTGRALREIGDAMNQYNRINRYAAITTDPNATEKPEDIDSKEVLDTMVAWFCLVFKNQFTPEEVYDNYPSDRLMHDMAFCLMAVQAQTTRVLSSFPTPEPAAKPKTKAK